MNKKYFSFLIIIIFVFIFCILMLGCTAPTGLSVYVTSISGSPADVDVAYTDHDDTVSTDPVINAIPNLTATIYATSGAASSSSSLLSISPSPWNLTSYTVSYSVVSSNVQTPAGFSINSYTSGTSVRLTAGSSVGVIFRAMDHVTRDWFVSTVFPTYGSMTLRATVTFTGKTDAGGDVSVTGQFDINTAEFAYSSS